MICFKDVLKIEASNLPYVSTIGHLVFLYQITINLKAKIVVELGCHEGLGSTVALLSACNDLKEAHLTSIDIADCHWAKMLHKDEPRWTFIKGDSIEVAKQWNLPIDHLFIDSSHEYNQTFKELQLWSPFVRDGGIITLHDTISYPDGVLKAIHDFTLSVPEMYAFSNRNNSCGLGILEKMKDV